ncbi:retrovirus-related pol polyprotein from transposon TNT 1-94 [Tanacetum coccineum]|uniref:Retrovirus-related pol polyprotein from transposon TNT 1-94 n=1 Tax=Tanacetum coccineum TaxID=301880 RepID=A0ABQ5DVD9_9ASTR
MINSQMDDMIKEKLTLKQQIDSLEQNLSNQIKESESFLQTFTVFKNESKEKENKYIDKETDLEKKIKEQDNFVYKVGQSAQTVHMLTKPQVFYNNAHKQALGYQNPFYLKKAQRIKPTLYDGSVISDKHVSSPVFDDEKTLIFEINFGKHFVPQQQLSDEQAFWLQTSYHNTDQSGSSPVKIEAPRELLKEHIKTMRENDKEEKVKHEMDKIETINIELEHTVAKLRSENKRLHKEIRHLKKIYKDQFGSIKKTRALSKEHDDSLIAQLNSKSMKNADLKRQIQDKVFVITSLKNDLRKLKRKEVENAAQIPIATTVAPGMFQLDLDPLAPRLLQNRKAHTYYLKHIQEQADILRAIVKQAKGKQPLDNALDLACKHATRIQESLVSVRDMCPNAIKLSEKKVAITPINKVKRVRFTPNKIVPLKETTYNSVETPTPKIKVYSRRPKQIKSVGSSKKAKIVESNIANNLEPNHLWGSNATYVPSSSLVNDMLSRFFSGTIQFRNDQVAKIMGYDDYQLGNVIISRVYYAEGLGHNLFSVRQFCDADLEVAFWKNTCYIRNLEGVDLLSGSKDTNLYTISLDDMLKTSPICLLSKASKTKSCKKSSHQPKAKDTNQEKLYLLHMDLCGVMRVKSINGKKYILVIVDDYSRFTQVRFLRSKDEAPDAIIKCIKNIQVHLKATVRNVRTDNGMEFVNQTLCDFYENLMHDKKPDLSFLYVFGSLCYPTNDSEDLGKLNAKVDIGPGLQLMIPATTSLGLVPNPITQQPCNPPNRDDWDRLFQPMFDEYFNPLTIVVSLVPVAIIPRAVDTTESPVSTSIDLDASSSSIPSTQEQEHSPIIS